jgi:Domain of unknown function (DUF1729)
MVAKEAHTSPSVKDLFVAAAGVDDSQWEGTYVKDTCGIIALHRSREWEWTLNSSFPAACAVWASADAHAATSSHCNYIFRNPSYNNRTMGIYRPVGLQ